MEGLAVSLEVHPLPLPSQHSLTELHWPEWREDDHRWLPAWRGDFAADGLHMATALAHDAASGRLAGAATVSCSEAQPETGVVGSVITDPSFRGRGIAEALTKAVTAHAFHRGCSAVLLGADKRPDCVYLACGFEYIQPGWDVPAGVMVATNQDADPLDSLYAAPGQELSLRAACWGDLAAVAALCAQPLSACPILDYSRGYASRAHGFAISRCVSTFPNLFEAVDGAGGLLMVAHGATAHRVVGFGSLTPGPAPLRAHRAVLEITAHDAHLAALDLLLEGLLAAVAAGSEEAADAAADHELCGVAVVEARVAEREQAKRAALSRHGFELRQTEPGAVHFGQGEAAEGGGGGWEAVEVWERSLAKCRPRL